MADMAPALTEAATEAHHRLKLAASSPASTPSVTQPEPLLPVWKPPELNGVRPGARRRPPNSGTPLLLLRRSSLNVGRESPIEGLVRRAGPNGEPSPWEGKEQRAMEAPGPHGGEEPPVSLCVPEDPPFCPKEETPAPECLQEGPQAPVCLQEEPLCPLRTARMCSRQQDLGARARKLCRRLQVIQAKQVERHVRQQLSGLAELLSDRGATGLSGSSQLELERLAESSTARLRAAQGGFDSDATESSSGGESDCEDPAVRPAGEQRLAAGCKQRADWRWTVERAAIICRWTWLQAQVSDLEFRIRQQTEIYKQIRCTKGGVVLGDGAQSEDGSNRPAGGVRSGRLPPSCSLSAGRVASGEGPGAEAVSPDKQCSRLTQSVGNVSCQNPPATPASESHGSQKPSRQVNGLVNCVRSGPACNGSAGDLDPDEALGKKRRAAGLPASALTESGCVAARTRPLRGYKKRRLVRSSAVSSLSRKPQKLLSVRCGCEAPAACILCGCKTHAKDADPGCMTPREQMALTDPAFHPILSFPHDTSLNLHFEALLKDDRRVRLGPGLRALKLSQLNKKPLDRGKREPQSPAADPAAAGYSHAGLDQEKLCLYRLETWQRSADRVRSQLRRSAPFSASQGSLLKEERPHKAFSSHVSTTPSRASSMCHPLSSLPDTSPASSAGSANIKRKRAENSYDINNIVIPMSMAAAARVEKLQYKEILTPSWRVLDSAERDAFLEADPQLEDLSDETYLNRHNAHEEQERSRWDSWASMYPQRRGSRSSNRSDGRWTPQPPSHSQGSLQPASPDVGFQSLNDVPLTLTSTAPDSPEPYSTVPCLSFRNRTRVFSWSEETRSSTPELPDEEEQAVLPWERRAFPLSDRDLRALQELPDTPTRGRSKQPPDVTWPPPDQPGPRTENTDFGAATENLGPPSKDPPLPNSISVVRFRANSGEKIASLEYFPARPVTKR
ncbi:KAT8 regulatory NSL complex subunit 1-like [Spea bombifrons]|uniref:KAT8 regulatory NSL complex subunit 1-like n=1 Tax=Spea bombifrons TaxID=233779 RepID=UPI00234A9259|nr:KAT8 regulatory NSL complex subunit 1-like [Spea bombifrons]